MLHNALKKDFPIFAKMKNLVYLDTAASSQTPKPVLDAMNEYYTQFRSNVHRGLYKTEEQATVAYEDARVKVARFIGADSHEIIFTAGATASSNMLVAMLEHSGIVNMGDEIVTTVMEHHASLIPLQEFAKRQDIAIKYIGLAYGEMSIDYDAAEKLITKKTKIVSVILASNVTGAINDVARIAEMAHKEGALVVVDATAAIGHMPMDVRSFGADFVYFSGHKMCGPTGIGVLWGKNELLEKLEPGVYGGGIVEKVTLDGASWCESPARFEAGTSNIAGVIGLGTSVGYLEKVGVENIHAHTQVLVKEAMARLEEISGVRILAERDVVKNIGIVSFMVEKIHAHDLAEILGREGVAIRAGHHCAEPLVTALGVLSTARASFYLYNNKEDIERLVCGVRKAKEIFKV